MSICFQALGMSPKNKLERTDGLSSKKRVRNCSINRLLCSILRTLPRSISPTRELYSVQDDVDVGCCKDLLVEQSLRKLISIVKDVGGGTILNELGDREVLRLIEMIRSDVLIERRLISELVLELLSHRRYDSVVVCGLSNELTSFIENNRNHVGIDNVLQMVGTVAKNRAFGSDDIAFVFYHLNVLRMVGTLFFESSGEAANTFESFIRSYPFLAPLTIRYFAKTFRGISLRSKTAVMSILCMITGMLEDEAYLSVEDNICGLMNASFESGCYSLVEEATRLLSSSKSYCVVERNAKTFIPKVFEAIYRSSKRMTKSQVLIKVLRNLHLLLMMDHTTFEACLKTYNMKRWEDKRAA